MSNATKPNYKATCLNGTKPACSGACPGCDKIIENK